MTLFEYLAIAFSLVFSFSGMRLVGGLPHAIQPDRRYWIHLGFVWFQLVSTVSVFWIFWSFKGVEWSFPKFLLVLSSPGILYYNACALVPENPSAVESWRDYFYSVRRRYFAGFICWVVAVMGISTIVLEIPIVHPLRVAQAGMLGASLTGLLSANPRVHAFLLAILCFGFATGAVVYGFQPGPLTPQ